MTTVHPKGWGDLGRPYSFILFFLYSAIDRSRWDLQIGTIDIADIFNAKKFLTKYFKNRPKSSRRTVTDL